jgi:hypothetical protein
MNKCNCTNSRTGEPKLAYATETQARTACEDSKKAYSDADALNSYYCDEGDCWHVGNRKRMQQAPVTVAFPDASPSKEGRLPPKEFEQPRRPEAPHVTVAISLVVAKAIGSAVKKAAKQVEPFVERGADIALNWTVAGLKASAGFLSEVHRKLEQRTKK